MGCLVEGNSTAHQLPTPDLTHSGLMSLIQSRHILHSVSPHTEPHAVGASENLFPGCFSPMWPLGRRYEGRGEAEHLPPPKLPSELQALRLQCPQVWFYAASHVHPILGSATHSSSRGGLQGPPVPETPRQTPSSHPDLPVLGLGNLRCSTFLPSVFMRLRAAATEMMKDKRTMRVLARRS